MVKCTFRKEEMHEIYTTVSIKNWPSAKLYLLVENRNLIDKIGYTLDSNPFKKITHLANALVGPDRLELSTHGLKVRCSTD